jgi:glycosyltransferase involved in cell wall biosynthesis
VKVLYDISALGHCAKLPARRTGIYRVTQAILLSLQARGDCDLYLTAGQSCFGRLPRLERFVNLHESLRLWLDNDVIHQIPFPHHLLSEHIINTVGESANIRWRAVLYALRLLQFGDYYTDAVQDSDLFHGHFHGNHFRFPSAIGPGKRVITVHDMIPIKFPEFVPLGRSLPEAFRRGLTTLDRADWIICSSEQTKVDFCHYTNHDPERVIVSYLAADPHLFYPCPEESAQSAVRKRYAIGQNPYILSLCALEPRKNLIAVIRAFSRLIRQESIADLKLVLVGPSGYKAQTLRSAMEESNLSQEQVIFPGYVQDSELAALYSGALFFVYPSYYEGFGLPVLEAMQCGVPVITSNSSSIPEVAGSACLLISPDDQEQLCASMLELYGSPALRRELSLAGIAQASKFSWEKCAAEIRQLYDRIIASTN